MSVPPSSQNNSSGAPNQAPSQAAGLEQFDGAPEEFLAALLAYQCRWVPAAAGAVLRVANDGGVQLLSTFPALPEGQAPGWLAGVRDKIPQVAVGGAMQVVAIRAPDDLYGQVARRYVVLVPLGGDASVRGAGAYLIDSPDTGVVETARQRLQSTSLLVAAYQSRKALQARQADMERMRTALETVSAVNEHSRFAAAAMAFCNEVATRWRAGRAGFGVLKGRYVQMKALSGTEKFSRKMQLVQDVESAMEECLDQDLEIVSPSDPSSPCIARAAGELARKHGPSAVLSVPMRLAGDPHAVLTVERPIDLPWTLPEIEALRLTCDLSSARLLGLYDTDRWIGAKAAGWLRRGVAVVVGPKHTWLKLIAIAVVAAVLAAVLVKGDYTVDAPFTVKATKEYPIVAPFEGTLDVDAAPVEPNTPVDADRTVLAAMDTTDLRLELLGEQANERLYRAQAAVALRDGKVVEAQQANAQADKSLAKQKLLQSHIDRAKLTCPRDGVVLAGEPSIGEPVKVGQVLFMVAPLESLRGELSVPEGDVVDLRVGQEGELAAVAYPDSSVRFTVERINRTAEVVSQRNVFKVRVRLAESPDWMRPGMEGTAKVNIRRASYAWILTRSLMNWIRMKLWAL